MDETITSDVFGKALMSYYIGEKEPIVLCREDGRKDEFDLQALFSSYHEWPEWEKKSLEHVKGKVLDIGCGAGRHSLWLQERGFKVVAIDISPLAVKVAKMRGVENPFLMVAQKLAFSSNSFDTVLLMGNNFGICGNVANTKRMMRQIYRITSRNGCVIATSNDVTKTSNPEHLKYQELNRNRGRPMGQITLRIEYKDEIGEWFDLLMVTPYEMEELLKPIGWNIKEVYESEHGLYAAILKKTK